MERDLLNGVFIIKEARSKEPAFADYDYDLACHVIAVDDNAAYLFDYEWPGYQTNKSHIPMKEESLAINGLGSFDVRIH